jgi:hypothetical protein
VRLTPEGLAPIEGVVDYAVPAFREPLAVRGSDGLYRFQCEGDQLVMADHTFADGVNGEETGKAWRQWLTRMFA